MPLPSFNLASWLRGAPAAEEEAPPPSYDDIFNINSTNHRGEEDVPGYESDDSWAVVAPSGEKSHQKTAAAAERASYDDEKKGDNKAAKFHECAHWRPRGCALSARQRRCCACLDKRPVTGSGLYTAYRDGRGFVEDARRWEHYCPGCRRYGDDNERRNAVASSSSSSSSSSRGMKNVEARGRQIPAAVVDDNDKGEKGFEYDYGEQREDEDDEDDEEDDEQEEQEYRGKEDSRKDMFASSRCSHWHPRGCALTGTKGRCCACADGRPHTESGLYAAYVDGRRGLVDSGRRWDGYCPGCRRALGRLHRKGCGLPPTLEEQRDWSTRATMAQRDGSGGEEGTWFSRAYKLCRPRRRQGRSRRN